MVLAQEHRATLFVALSQIATKDAAEAMLAEFPNHELDEPVTKGFVRAEIAEVRTEIADLRGELKGEIAELRGELKGDIGDLRAEMHSVFRSQIMWIIGVLVPTIVAAAFLG